MRLSGLEPETYGLKVVPSSSPQVAAGIGDSGARVAGSAEAVQRKAQRFETGSVPAGVDPAGAQGQHAALAEIVAAWPTLTPEAQAQVLAIMGANGPVGS